MMDGTAVNVDATAPGATLALALMFLKVISSKDDTDLNSTLQLAYLSA